MKNVKFDFGDGVIYDGFTDGTTWNGFNNIWISDKVYRQMLNNFNHMMYDFRESGLFELTQDEEGLYSLSYGFSTIIVNEKGEKNESK
jgi:hypothetical protein